MDLDPLRVARLGLSTAEVQAQARAALFGSPAGTAREPDRLVPIRVRLTDSVRLRPDVVSQVPIVGPGGWVSLGAVGAVRDTSGPSQLLRENLRPYVAVTGRTSGRSLGGVTGDVRSAVSRRAAAGRRHARDRRPVREPAAVVQGASRHLRAGTRGGDARTGGAVRRISRAAGAHRRGAARSHRVPGDARHLRRGLQRVELHGRDSTGGPDRQERDPAARRGPSRFRLGSGHRRSARSRRAGCAFGRS